MSRRALLPLGLAVTGLLVVVAVASRGRPLGGGGSGAGPTAGFFDYVLTTIVIVAAAIAVVVAVLLAVERPQGGPRKSAGRRYLSSMVALFSALGIAWLLTHSTFERRLLELREKAGRPGEQGPASRAKPPPPGTRAARLRWDEVAIVLSLLAAAGVAAFATRSRRRAPPLSWRHASQTAVSLALDESLDDLRSEPDLRKAIVAAYARMERALALAGLPRRPAEAPLEYLERALSELETSAAAVRRLTELFEWAKFSQHEPEPRMRDEAVDALVAVRDELRAPDADAVAA